MKIVILILSFLLDGIISNLLPIHSLFSPLFTLVALIIIYPYFNNNSDFYKHAFFIGLAYDLIYTDTFVFYAFMFVFISFIIARFSVVFADNYLNLCIITLVSIVIFRSMTYLFIVLTGNMRFDFNVLLRGIYSALLMNIIYVIFLNFIVNKISLKFNIRKSLRY